MRITSEDRLYAILGFYNWCKVFDADEFGKRIENIGIRLVRTPLETIAEGYNCIAVRVQDRDGRSFANEDVLKEALDRKLAVEIHNAELYPECRIVLDAMEFVYTTDLPDGALDKFEIVNY